MGVKLGDLAVAKRTDLRLLSGKVVAVDALNALYQFLSTIRQRDGTPLMTSRGKITSVHSGVFYRTARLLGYGMTPIYVFDGEPPRFKRETIEKREEERKRAREKWEEALTSGRIEEARKYARSALFITPSMMEDAKKLLGYMGLPTVQAPSEGEAQAAHMVRRGDAWATISQDYDSLLFGAPQVVRNLTLSERRKVPGQDRYVKVYPERIDLEETLASLGISRGQLVMIGILIGTDYNPGGVRGIGGKKALKLVKEHRSPEKLFSLVDWRFEIDPIEIYDLFMDPPTTDSYEAARTAVSKDELYDFMVRENEFSPKRVEKAIERLEAHGKERGLEGWL